MVFITTLIATLLISLMLYNPGISDCIEVCAQPVPEEPTVCEMVCEKQIKQSGLLVTLTSAAMTTPIVIVLGKLFEWLRKPVIKAIEPKEGVGMLDILKRINKAKSHYDNQKTVVFEKEGDGKTESWQDKTVVDVFEQEDGGETESQRPPQLLPGHIVGDGDGHGHGDD